MNANTPSLPNRLFDKCPSCDSTEVHEMTERFLDLVWFSMKCTECEYTETRDVRVPVGRSQRRAA